MTQRTCTIDGCGKKHVARGLCPAAALVVVAAHLPQTRMPPRGSPPLLR